MNNSHWILPTYCLQSIIPYNAVGAYVQAIKVTRRCSAGQFHMICGHFYGCVNRATVPAPFSEKRPIVCHCPNWFTHCPFVSKPPVCYQLCDKHRYLLWEHASSQLEDWSAAKFYAVFWRMIKRLLGLMNSEEALWYSVCVLLAFLLFFLKQPTPPKTWPDSLLSLFLLKPSVYCCGLAAAQLCSGDINGRPRDSSIRQHPLQRALLTALCEAKPNQMCMLRLIFTTPSDSASISMPRRAFVVHSSGTPPLSPPF